MEDKKKVIVYVDGFNFYYGLKSKKWKMCYWLDLVSFFNSFLKPYQELVEVNYFSARPTDAGKHDRQDKLFQANKCNPKFNLILGKYLKKEIKCRYCGGIIHSFEEKEKLIGYVINRDTGGYISQSRYGYGRYGKYQKYRKYAELDEETMNTEDTL